MKYKQGFIVCIALILMSFGLSKRSQKIVDKEIKKSFSIETYNFSNVEFDLESTKDLPSKFEENNLFKVENEDSIFGYAYISKAPSKTAEFDYLVLLDKDLVILKSKVLAYREEYGGEIGSTRWLKQFIGKKGGDELNYGDNIVAISGATISVRSMTNALNNLLISLKILQDKNLL